MKDSRRPPPPLLTYSAAYVRRGQSDVLRNITFSVGSCESLAILGPNGSGKSTLIKTITRELYVTGGTLRVMGKENWDLFDLRSHLGIVSNDLQTNFDREMTGLEAVLSGFFGSVGLWTNNRPTREMMSKSTHLLRTFELDHLANKSMRLVSSGEARRLLIARALVHSPRTLVFDEPTNSLDLTAQYQLRKTLRRLAKSGIGIIIATHHLSEIIPEIVRVLMLRDGTILADGRKEAILKSTNLRSLFGVPVSVVEHQGYYHAF